MKEQPEFKVCGCGRNINRPFNSSIWPKVCISCQRVIDNKKLMQQSSFKKNSYVQKPTKYSKKNTSGKNVDSPKTKAMKLADKWFSRWIRIKHHRLIATDGTVFCKCIITGSIKAANLMDNGHCFSREFKATRYEEDNCRPQNRSSNRFSGEADHYKFRDHLMAEIGEERFNRIDQLRKENGENNIIFFKEQSDKYKKLTNDLLEELGAKKWW